MPPLIVTALLDEVAQERFDRLRREHFPPERNHLDAHLTLFHRLPDDPEVDRALAVEARRPPLTAQVRRVRGWRGGVAYDVAAPELSALRARLARAFDPWLSGQDRAKADLHVTVQNKAEPAAAERLHAQLAAGFAPYDVHVVGLGLWRYLGGPWEPVRQYAFGR
jgi:2'-5' RNA ligase superfamily protein